MKTRIISAILWLPLLVFCIYVGGGILLTGLMVMSLVGQNEFFKAVGLKKDNGKYILFASTVALYLSEMLYGDELFFILLMITFLAVFTYFMFKFQEIEFEKIAMYMFSVLYIPFTFIFVYRIRSAEFGLWLIWIVFILAFSSDTFAYFSGKFFGKRKLAPILSPNKTIEGAIGGIIGSMLMTYLYVFIMVNNTDINFVLTTSNTIFVLAVGFFGAIISQFGDLSASAIKRQKGVKDYGNFIKGHGGILDRFDSVIFTTQFLYIILFLI